MILYIFNIYNINNSISKSTIIYIIGIQCKSKNLNVQCPKSKVIVRFGDDLIQVSFRFRDVTPLCGIAWTAICHRVLRRGRR